MISSSRITESQENSSPNGSAMAALLAAGIGCFAFGLFIVLAEVSETIHDFMLINKGVGTLSGKSTYAVLVWVLVWVGLQIAWNNKDLNTKNIYIATFVFLVAGLLLTFPPFYTLFG